jgi:hypothetical protein
VAWLESILTAVTAQPGWDPTTAELVEQLARAVRGPRREGVFAVWLTVRVAQDLQADPPIPERAHRRRVAALERRLSSLTVPPPLRRALAGAVAQLKDARPEAAALVLSQLVAPIRDTLGRDAAESVMLAAQAARTARTARPA